MRIRSSSILNLKNQYLRTAIPMTTRSAKGISSAAYGVPLIRTASAPKVATSCT